MTVTGFCCVDIKGRSLSVDVPVPELGGKEAVFIEKIELSSAEMKRLGSEAGRVLHVFGALVKTGEIHPDFGELKRFELAVVESKEGRVDSILHHLAQHDTVMYKRDTDRTGEQCADMLTRQEIKFLRRPPRWKVSDASVPECQGELFHFCRQIYIPENKTTRQNMTWGCSLFLFVFVNSQDELLVQVFQQDMSEQTAEDHYRLEEMMMEFDQHYQDSGRVGKLIEKGDKFFHEYVLNHERVNGWMLGLLLENARTKAFKTLVLKKYETCVGRDFRP